MLRYRFEHHNSLAQGMGKKEKNEQCIVLYSLPSALSDVIFIVK